MSCVQSYGGFVQELTSARTTDVNRAERVSIYWAALTANVLIQLTEPYANIIYVRGYTVYDKRGILKLWE